MSSNRALVLRLLTLLCGLVLILAGAVTLGVFYQQQWAWVVVNALRPEWWAQQTHGHHAPGFFAITAAVLIVIGLLLWWVIFDRRGVTSMRLAESSSSGKLVVRLDDVASAMAQDIRRLPQVAGCSYKAETDRGEKVIELRIRCESGADLAHVTQACRQSAEHLELALPHEEVSTRYLVEVNRLSSRG